MNLLDKILAKNEKFILAIDPGVTSGVAWVHPGCPTICTDSQDQKELLKRIKTMDIPDLFIVEEFRLYPWMAQTFSWSSLGVPRLIGRIEQIAEDRAVPLVFQPAAALKTVQHLSLSGGDDHAKDAAGHLVHYLINCFSSK